MTLSRFYARRGLFAGVVLFLYIRFEATPSGMSMNPARTRASAAPAVADRSAVDSL